MYARECISTLSALIILGKQYRWGLNSTFCSISSGIHWLPYYSIWNFQYIRDNVYAGGCISTLSALIILANSTDGDEIPHFAAFHLGFTGCHITPYGISSK